ncbi:hypothetical protein CU669_05790 [Paramagnetospirillum kuznetsovii]|uniref:Uncharacterized protein n=1 Tax=Paramagnetospirillum kuznetsovii TaxID=2053833 RepID=A0A364P0R5_9PROT|nr:flagellin [Paramagnetospirillum kuznetsovii]RAU22893.1 hypothetical protein CU669_05790 [Paramagnetospirillum kuznetsovii]
MTRIGTLGANTAYVDRILDIQSRMNDGQLQVSTGLKSQTYAGIATDANSLLNFETEKASAQQFIKGNTSVGTKLSAAASSLTGIQKSLKTFQNQLSSFYSGNTTDRKNVEQIQGFAYQAMLDIQSYLGANVNGQYLFAGGRVSQDPVQLPASTLSGFQAIYNGSTVQWPTSRSAQLLSTTMTSSDTTQLIVNSATGTIRAADADSLSQLATGARFSITNSVSNNTTYQVRAHAAMNVGGTALAEGTSAVGAATISYGSTPTNLSTAAGGTGALTFAFAANGNMTMTPANANTLSPMTAGTKFTINGSTGNAWDGAYKVVSNLNGVVEFATDTDQGKTESLTQTATTSPLSLSLNYGAATSLTTGAVSMTAVPSTATGKTTITVTTTGATDFAAYSVGDTITIGGSGGHNGTFTVSAVGAGGSSVSFVENSDAVRVSQFVPQTGRSDVAIKFQVGPGATNDQITAGSGTSANTGYGTLTFSPTGTTGERITGSAGATSFVTGGGALYPAVGQVIQLSSTSGVNDGSYTVTANTGSYIEVQSILPTSETVSTAKIDASSWYKGDTLQVQHRIDDDRQVNVGIYASDTAFEKAFRALGLIAQGAFGTAGGLDQNQQRITQAKYLLNDAIESPAAGTPPFGTEMRGDINSVQQNLGFVQQVIANKNSKHQSFIDFLQTRIDGIEQIDKNVAVTSLLSDSNALQASYQSLAKIQGLSLLNYLH